MRNSVIAMLLVALLGCDDATDGDRTPDSSTDATADQPGSCRQTPDPLDPHYRMTLLDLQSPDRLDNPVLEQSILNEALRAETILWLISSTATP